MKKLILMFSFLLFWLSSSICQITDHDSYIKVTYKNGTVLSISKDQVESLKIDKAKVYVMTSRMWGNDPVTRIISLSYADFEFGNVNVFYNYLNAILFRSYKITYHYTNGLMDTVSYYAGDSLAFRTAYQYSGSVISQKSAPINE